ncbi:uncharacterized protein VTP21DRAFT_473 [Calcarisporiella thermophila]|uniref:uncharacterized protein n=1 Tax=Calcarisporiella thermophila TaxID=911321 RepID=UPI00374476E6
MNQGALQPRPMAAALSRCGYDCSYTDSSSCTSRASTPVPGEEEPPANHRGGRRLKAARKQVAYVVNGVNILNRNEIDSKTTMERIIRRRECHNNVERRRRDNINQLITEIGELIPAPNQDKRNKGAILGLAVEYIRELQQINQALLTTYKQQQRQRKQSLAPYTAPRTSATLSPALVFEQSKLAPIPELGPPHSIHQDIRREHYSMCGPAHSQIASALHPLTAESGSLFPQSLAKDTPPELL